MFAKNLLKIKDDPLRFGSASVSFLSEEGTIAEINSAIARLRKVAVPQVDNYSSLFNCKVDDQSIERAQKSAPVEPDPSVHAGVTPSEHKRKLSIAEDESASKKPRHKETFPAEPKR